MAGNGLFIQTENPMLQATVCIASAKVRGLAPLVEDLRLTHGKIPGRLLGDALRAMMLSMSRELYVAVVWEDGRYSIRVPNQEAGAAHVTYQQLPNKVLDLHSHPSMSGNFSGIDNRDEVGFQLYGVIGHLDHLIPEYSFRLGMYGHFKPLGIGDVFDGYR
jgi:PRTRC genetic system protein A